MSAHTQFKVETGIPVFFADPQSPWQRGTNENTNGLLRQYFPKGTDLSRWSNEEIEAVANALNTRPRKTLDSKTPAEAFNEHLPLLQQAGVASPVESGQFTPLAFTEALVDAGITSSIGTFGDALDNALMESTIGLFKTEVIDHEQTVWTGWRQVEEATASRVHWFNSERPSLFVLHDNS